MYADGLIVALHKPLVYVHCHVRLLLGEER
jgi:hypothetical protein